MISYLGNFAEDATVYIMFNTFTSDDPSASCTITNFINTDVHIHKDDGLGQRNNAAGITVSVDFDGITGSHMIKIDTSDNTVAGFWVVGHEYFVRIEGTTIDGATINSVVGQFSIENRHNEVDVVKWLGQACAAVTVNGVPEVDMTHISGGAQSATDLKDFADAGYDPTTNKVQGVVLVDTTTVNTDRAVVTTTVSTSNTASIFTCAGGAAAASAYKGMIIEVTDAGDGNTETRRLDSWTSGRVVVVDRDFSFTPAVGDVVRVLPYYADINVQAISGNSTAANNAELAFDGTGYGFANCIMPVVTTLTGHTAQTGDNFARIGAPVGASISADLVAIEAYVDELESRLSAARAGYLDNLSAGAVALASGVDLTKIHGVALTETVNGYLAAAFTKLFDVATPLLISSEVMRGTDSAYTGTPPTAAAIVNEWESQSQADPTGFHVNVKEVNGTAQTANDNSADINSILTDTAEIGVAGAGLTDLGGMSTGMKAEIESEANDALIALNLDHLMKTATGGADMTAEVVDNTVLSRILANGDTSIFVPSSDGLQPIRDQGDSAWITAAGFSTHSAADIWTVVTRALTDKSGFALSATGANLILKDSTFALALADAVADEELTGATHNVVNSLGRRVREIGAYAINSGTAQAGNATCITLAATASAIDGTYNRNLLVITDNTGVGQTRTIIDYDGSTKIATIDREWRTNPDATSVYQIVADDTPLVVDQGVAQAGSTSSTIKLRAYASSINDTYLCNIVIIVAGAGRGQARLVGAYNGTTKVVTLCGDNWVTTPDDTSVYVMIPYGATCTSCVGDDALAQINTEMDNVLNTAIPGSPTAHSINQRIKAIDELTEGSGSGDLAAILTDTDELQIDWVNGGRLDLLLDACALEATVAALNDISVADIIAGIADGSYDLQEMMRIMFAVISGKSAGGGTSTVAMRDADDGKNRISATVDSNGNRTAVTRDGS